MNTKVMFSSASDNWKTPGDVYKKLNDEFNFDFDPCPLSDIPVFDGLAISWGERNFVNPPYSRIKDWTRKCYEQHLDGKLVVLLIPSRTDTAYWHDYIMKADEIRFIRGRLRFGDAKSCAPFPSAIIIFGGVK